MLKKIIRKNEFHIRKKKKDDKLLKSKAKTRNVEFHIFVNYEANFKISLFSLGHDNFLLALSGAIIN